MMNQVIASPGDVDATWLTTMLTKAGALEKGKVTRVHHERLEGNWSSNAFLTLSYSKDALGECPKRLFIKTSNGFGPSEVFYYTRDYVGVDAAPLVRCFDAAYDADRRRYHILLQDVSVTHELVLHQAANLEYAEALADGFAAMHARWWGPGRFSEINEVMPTPRVVHRFVDIARPGVAHLRQHYSDEIGAKNLDTIDRFFEEHPREGGHDR